MVGRGPAVVVAEDGRVGAAVEADAVRIERAGRDGRRARRGGEGEGGCDCSDGHGYRRERSELGEHRKLPLSRTPARRRAWLQAIVPRAARSARTWAFVLSPRLSGHSACRKRCRGPPPWEGARELRLGTETQFNATGTIRLPGFAAGAGCWGTSMAPLPPPAPWSRTSTSLLPARSRSSCMPPNSRCPRSQVPPIHESSPGPRPPTEMERRVGATASLALAGDCLACRRAPTSALAAVTHLR